MKLLKENGWKIHVAARNNLAEKNGLELEYPDKVFDIPFQRSPFDKRNINAYIQLREVLKEEHYDVIHCNTPVGGMLARLAGNKYRKNGTQIFYTAHGFHFYQGAPLRNWVMYYPLEKIMSNYTDKLITITEEDYRLAEKKFHCPVYHIHGVGANSQKYHPVSTDEKEQIKKELGIKGHIIINVGELLPNKNQKTAIRAMKEVIKRYPDAYLLIAGNGKERKNLEDLARIERIEKNVVFLGYTTQLQKYLNACDLEIACSYREGLPLNVMEAMMCGKPVVASHNRGHDELIVDGVTGFLVAPDNPQEYAEAVCRILKQPLIYADNCLHKIKPFMDIRVQEELGNIYDL